MLRAPHVAKHPVALLNQPRSRVSGPFTTARRFPSHITRMPPRHNCEASYPNCPRDQRDGNPPPTRRGQDRPGQRNQYSSCRQRTAHTQHGPSPVNRRTWPGFSSQQYLVGFPNSISVGRYSGLQALTSVSIAAALPGQRLPETTSRRLLPRLAAPPAARRACRRCGRLPAHGAALVLTAADLLPGPQASPAQRFTFQ